MYTSEGSYSYEEDYSGFDDNPLFNYDIQYNDPSIQSDETPCPEIDELIPDPVIPDPAVAVCHSLDQSKQLIQNRFGINTSSLHSHPIPGLVILPLKDINLIRKDHRNNRKLNHILVIPEGENFQLIHNDFVQCLNILNS